jgi:hypothetical protein
MAQLRGGVERVGGGCGVSGCLYAAVALFALLMIGILVVALFRFTQPPEPRLGPQQAPPPLGFVAPADAPVHPWHA